MSDDFRQAARIVQLESQLSAQHNRLSQFANFLERITITALDEDDWDATKREIAEAAGREAEFPELYEEEPEA